MPRREGRRGPALVLAVVSCLALVIGACNEVPGAEEVGEGMEEITERIGGSPSPDEGAGQGEGDDADDRTVGEAGDGHGGAGGEGESGEAAGTEAATSVADLGGVGANGPAMLRPDRGTLVVEVDVQEGLDPDPAALDHLIAELASVVDKPGGIVTAGGNRFASDQRSWTPAALREVAEANRSNYADGDSVTLYVLYVRGRFEDEGAIGVAYNASEFAVFPERWADVLGTVTGGSSRVERSVLVHEAGHLFGLVNLTYESRFDREDPDHPGHSSSRGSVMHWAIETTAVGQVFSGPPPDRFDDADRADLGFLRTGSW